MSCLYACVKSLFEVSLQGLFLGRILGSLNFGDVWGIKSRQVYIDLAEITMFAA